MSQPPKDRAEFWIRSVCAFLVFGLVAALVIFHYIDALGIPLGLWLWFSATITVSAFAARFGDSAWHKLTDVIRFWLRFGQ